MKLTTESDYKSNKHGNCYYCDRFRTFSKDKLINDIGDQIMEYYARIKSCDY